MYFVVWKKADSPGFAKEIQRCLTYLIEISDLQKVMYL